jgi:hypothetical protein
VIFLTFFLNFGKGTLYRESVVNALRERKRRKEDLYFPSGKT